MSVAQSDGNVKRCEGSFGCGQVKPVSEFWKNDRSCKVCRTKRKALIESGAAPKARFRGAARADKPRDTPPPPIDNETPRVDPAYAIMPYQGVVVAFEQDYSMVCITDIWRAAGSPGTLRPNDWLDSVECKGLIEAYARADTTMGCISQTRVGNAKAGAGTWLPREIALAYAQRLNPDLWLACNRFILEKMRPADVQPPVMPNEANEALILLREMARRMGILVELKHDTTAILGAVNNATLIKTQEVWRGQIYIGLLTCDALLTLARREYTNIPPNAKIIFVGRTAPSGSVHDLRIEDYAGKFAVRPEDYELLATFGTDDPKSAESLLLNNPMRNCNRLRSSKGTSKTFIAATGGAERHYTALKEKHYPIVSLQMVITGIGGQMDLFGGAA